MSRAVLIILDGFGIGKDSPFNAISNAKMPFYRDLIARYPHSRLITHGEAVGLPEGVMGNSEVGHMTMGAGRIVYQDLSRISKAMREGELKKNPALRQAIEAGRGRVHLMGLLSDGGVHSHIDHLLALLDLCLELGATKIGVHPFLDGRDTPPDSSFGFLERLLAHPAFEGGRARIATVSGRYWAMDRDQRWERVEKAYRVLTGQAPTTEGDVLTAVRRSHLAGKTDEFVEPALLYPTRAMRDGDSVIFFNYRSDRARELTTAILAREFTHFDRGRGFRPSAFAGMTVYDKNFETAAFTAPFRAAFPPQNLEHIFGEWLEEKSLTQFRIAETEKYAHVTFFFNGGREAPFRGEDRLLIPSPKDVPTYDLKPEMSAFAVADAATQRIEAAAHSFVLMNFANADMVGHTGNYEAAVKAMEALDRCLSQVIGAAERSGYHTLLTADHGNAEEMRDEQGRIHTQHTLNPVPAIWIPPGSAVAPKTARPALADGTLADVMPTLCGLMGLPVPPEADGKNLLPPGGP